MHIYALSSQIRIEETHCYIEQAYVYAQFGPAEKAALDGELACEPSGC